MQRCHLTTPQFAWLFLFSTTLTLNTELYADQADEPPLETLIVTAHRLAVTNPILPSLTRSVAGEASVGADVLRSLPNMAISQSGNLGGLTQVRVRGAEANHLLVLLDGLELNDPAADGEFNFANLSLATTPHLEYLPGAQSAIWGSDAVAGVLHLSSTPLGKEQSLRLQGGSFGTLDTALTASDRGERGHYRVALQRFETDGTNIARNGTEDDGFTSESGFAAGTIDGAGWQLQGLIRRLRANADFDPAPFPAFVPVDGDNHTEHDSTLIGLTGRLLDLPGNWSQHLTISQLTSKNLGYAEATRTGYSEGERRKVSSISRWQKHSSAHVDLVLEYEQERFEQRGNASFFGDPNQRQRTDQWSAGAEWAFAPAERLGLSLSTRFDSNSDYDDSVSYRLAARYQLSEALALWTNIGTGIKNPSFIERFGFTPDTFIGNPQIEPETNEHASLGLLWQRGRLHSSVTLFRDELEDEINGFAFDATLGGFTALNEQGSSERNGIEVDTDWQGERTQARAGISYVDAKDPDNNREVRRPRWQAFVELGHQVGALSLWSRINYVDDQRDLSFASFPASEETLDSYTLWSARLGWQLSPALSLSLRGDNLLDQTVENVFGFRGPGRGGYLEVTLRRP
ncbi:MAG: TonB-dependent receptor plug domain-containing protein [Pseudomonadales bacterium]